MAVLKFSIGTTLLVILLGRYLLTTGISATTLDCMENNWDAKYNLPLYSNTTTAKHRILLKFVIDEFFKLIEYFNNETVRILEHMLQDPIFEGDAIDNSNMSKSKQKLLESLKSALKMKTVHDQYNFLNNFSNEIDDIIRKDYKGSTPTASTIMTKVWEEHGLLALSAELEKRLSHFFQAFITKFEDYQRGLTKSELQSKPNVILKNWFRSMKTKTSLDDLVESFTEFFQFQTQYN